MRQNHGLQDLDMDTDWTGSIEINEFLMIMALYKASQDLVETQPELLLEIQSKVQQVSLFHQTGSTCTIMVVPWQLVARCISLATN
eukprot:1349234-Rhodomonas_salina.1